MVYQVSLPKNQKAACFHCGVVIPAGSVCFEVQGGTSFYIAIGCKSQVSYLKDLEPPNKPQ